MTSLSREHRRFLILEEAIGSVIVNFPLNAAIAWFTVRALPVMPLWGFTSIAGDTFGTAFILPVLTSLITSRLVGHHVGKGRVSPLTSAPGLSSRRAERGSFQRGAEIGLASMVVAALPVVLLFAAMGVTELAPASFIWFKATFAAALGAVVTPLLAWWALAHPAQRAPLPRAPANR